MAGDLALSTTAITRVPERYHELPVPIARCVESRYDQIPWPHALAAVWRAVADGVAAVTAAQWLWPAYLDHVSAWLADTSSMAARAQSLRAAATELLVTLTPSSRESS
jgi:hypothetical protein